MPAAPARTATTTSAPSEFLTIRIHRRQFNVAGLGLVKKEDANVQQYVTGKTLDGLYFMIDEQEKKIRRDPVGAGSAVLQRVFGALQ